MEKNVITMSDVSITLDELLSELHLDPEDDSVTKLESMLHEAVKIARPKAIYAPFSTEPRDGVVFINDVKLEEPFLHKMLSGCETVVPYVMSCGCEIDEWAKSFTDFLDKFAADTIKEMYLFIVRNKLFSEVHEKYYDREKNISTLRPGSLKDWPLWGQKALFSILGGVTDDIGVVLTKSMLMIPNKSVSGIIFQSETLFENCQFCPKPQCPHRRAAYAD